MTGRRLTGRTGLAPSGWPHGWRRVSAWQQNSGTGEMPGWRQCCTNLTPASAFPAPGWRSRRSQGQALCVRALLRERGGGTRHGGAPRGGRAGAGRWARASRSLQGMLCAWGCGAGVWVEWGWGMQQAAACSGRWWMPGIIFQPGHAGRGHDCLTTTACCRHAWALPRPLDPLCCRRPPDSQVLEP